MHLADAAEVRVLQQTAAKSKLSSQISDLPSRPVSSVTGERCTLLNMKCSAFLSPYATVAIFRWLLLATLKVTQF